METSDNLVILNKKQRAEFRVKMLEKTAAAGWKLHKTQGYKHHLTFEVAK